MNYVIHDKAKNALVRFYHNVAKKYKHTYSEELMNKNIVSAYNSIYQIENGLMRRQPTMPRWKGMFMATAGKWNFAYKIEGDTVYVYDACHSQNIHESSERRTVILTESELKGHLKKAVRRVLNESFILPNKLSAEEVQMRFLFLASRLYQEGKITKDEMNTILHYGLYFCPLYTNGFYSDIVSNNQSSSLTSIR